MRFPSLVKFNILESYNLDDLQPSSLLQPQIFDKEIHSSLEQAKESNKIMSQSEERTGEVEITNIIKSNNSNKLEEENDESLLSLEESKQSYI